MLLPSSLLQQYNMAVPLKGSKYRLREKAFGGVTNTILHQMTTPVFMCRITRAIEAWFRNRASLCSAARLRGVLPRAHRFVQLLACEGYSHVRIALLITHVLRFPRIKPGVNVQHEWHTAPAAGLDPMGAIALLIVQILRIASLYLRFGLMRFDLCGWLGKRFCRTYHGFLYFFEGTNLNLANPLTRNAKFA